MSDQPRDWDKELAAIDKAMARMPAAAPGAAVPAPRQATSAVAPISRRARLAGWARVALAAALAVAVPLWPYLNECGVSLFAYLAAIAATLVAGLWAGVGAWRRNMGFAHTLSLLVALWALVLGAREVLPRIGYAKVSRAWLCAAPPAPNPSPVEGPERP